ncbi:MAG: electron transport complex subunit RsxC [Planctomycetota bacterium]
MISRLKDLPGKGNFRRGIHPPDAKEYAAEQPIEVLPTPSKVSIPLVQHIGAPCQTTVKPRQEVALGDPVGQAGAFVSAPVHATVNGKTGMASVATLPNGRHVSTVPITAGEEQLSGEALREEIYGGEWPTENLQEHTPEQIAEAVRSAGIVGMGGAAFPTHVKLTRNEAKPVDTLLLNGCECEPYLTADYRLMLEHPEPIITGALLAAHGCGAEQVIIAIEDNKPQAVETMRIAAAGTGIKVAVVDTKYPMGGERQAVLAVLGREVPTAGLPLDVGVVVLNVGTASAIARAVLRGKPLTHRIITVSGGGVEQAKNLLAPIGVSYGDLLECCGGAKHEAGRVIAGGPMMGFALADLDTPVTKGTSGMTVLTHEEIHDIEETTCIRCGRCVDVCPLHLVPTKAALASKARDWDLCKKYQLSACCECGCCGYICPAGIPLVQLMRMGKALMPRD